MEILHIGCAETAPVPTSCVTALGFFDGVHRGHRLLLERTVSEAHSRGMTPTVLTFSRTNTDLKSDAPRLTSEEEHLRLIEACGITHVFLVDFASVRTLSPDAFVRDILTGLCHTKLAVSGFNFRFGYRAAGDPDTLTLLMRTYGGDALVLPPERLPDGRLISSTAIRDAVAAGDMETAHSMLGRPHTLVSPVLHGAALGRTIGFPTINQTFPANSVLPAFGVYAVTCETPDGTCLGVANVGVRPTVSGSSPNCETHFIGYNGDLYGATVRTAFLNMLRPERKFPSLDALREQIEKDKQKVEELYGK